MWPEWRKYFPLRDYEPRRRIFTKSRIPRLPFSMADHEHGVVFNPGQKATLVEWSAESKILDTIRRRPPNDDFDVHQREQRPKTRLRLFVVNVLPIHLYQPPELKHYSSKMDNRTVDSLRGFKRSRLKIDGDGDLCRSAMSFDSSIHFSLRNLLFLWSAV